MKIAEKENKFKCINSLKNCTELMKLADRLTPEDQLRLASYLLEKISHCEIKPMPRHNVKEFRGIAPNHMSGMDAQEYVNRISTRRIPRIGN